MSPSKQSDDLLPLPTRIAFVGNYLPRQCGIATFTTDLCDAVSREYGDSRLFAIAVNDSDSTYDYPERVRLEIDQEDATSYERAADFLNFNGNDLVCLQHEYGIYGGKAGAHVLLFMRKLKMPIVTTLHTVLREPDAQQLAVLEEIAEISDRLVVMSDHAATLLREVYRVPDEKIDFIPHGVPALPFTDPNYFKDVFGAEGMSVLLTFGLLSPNKGIENVIRALPEILKENSEVLYVVSGATHPHIRRREGERYRKSLQALAKEIGVFSRVRFNNSFVSAEELMVHVGAADIYLTPYRQEAQVVSGTLAIALGAGKAIVSTPYWHAKELLAEDRGVLVPFDDPAAIAAAVNRLLRDDAKRHAMRKRAYLYSKGSTWEATAVAYMNSFQQARVERMYRPRPVLREFHSKDLTETIPHLNIDHLIKMTDDTGMLQHAIFSLPNCQEGYTTDDNARALIVSVGLGEELNECSAAYELLSHRYLAFLWLAFNQNNGRFRNFLSYGREWLEDVGSEDSHARSLWALGRVLGNSVDIGLRAAAGRLFEAAYDAPMKFTSPRAWAFSMLGFQSYLDGFPGDRVVQAKRNELADRLLVLYDKTHTDTWKWFEKSLSYSNARIPQALLLAGASSQNERMILVGCESLAWLIKEQHLGDPKIFVPVGSKGFTLQDGEKARFDQQPVEACATVSACMVAYSITQQTVWLDEAWSAFRWFLGENDLQIPLYDPVTGGCRDGLHPDRVNENQGAESTLSFLMACIEMRAHETERTQNFDLEMSAVN